MINGETVETDNYDRAGKIKSATVNGIKKQYTYDEKGNLISLFQSSDSFVALVEVNYRNGGYTKIERILKSQDDTAEDSYEYITTFELPTIEKFEITRIEEMNTSSSGEVLYSKYYIKEGAWVRYKILRSRSRIVHECVMSWIDKRLLRFVKEAAIFECIINNKEQFKFHYSGSGLLNKVEYFVLENVGENFRWSVRKYWIFEYRDAARSKHFPSVSLYCLFKKEFVKTNVLRSEFNEDTDEISIYKETLAPEHSQLHLLFGERRLDSFSLTKLGNSYLNSIGHEEAISLLSASVTAQNWGVELSRSYTFLGQNIVYEAKYISNFLYWWKKYEFDYYDESQSVVERVSWVDNDGVSGVVKYYYYD